MFTQITTDIEWEEVKNPNISLPNAFYGIFVELFLIIL